MRVYRVGGVVRDRLLGRSASDADYVVVGATPEAMLERGFRPVGLDFPVFLHPNTGEEYALARTERKTGSGYHGFVFHAGPEVTLEKDLERRDLTINAMAEDADGRIIDPFGGRRDLAERVLRHVSPAFREDPVRILRLARFHARFPDFSIARETRALCRQMVEEGEVDHLVSERVWQELSSALMETRPSRCFELLHETGALGVILPELERLFGVPQVAEHHPEIDAGVHTLMVVDQAARLGGTLPARFAALVHDLGKGLTPAYELPRHVGHEKAGLAPIREVCERLRVSVACRDMALLVGEHHLVAHRALELRPSTVVRLFERIDAFRRPERLEPFLLACEADRRGRTGREDEPYPQADFLRHAHSQASAVSARVFVERGLKGPAIAEAVHAERVRRVATASAT
ncbi:MULTISPECIES: multifunctional CCA addition/repair protein [unclassified Wenzhouxiangella]|uniref:multifunctional CCA addition/repair protein n=1 Tax=unclassified Wenzhouxiangella TaxID=2613841 RepID=UPI000E325A58|nr:MULTISPECIES: multifunctional CCA addition/repair protein [unclassified Wenzhouxiangella]RFF27080.1 multifunctional CCA addition/repair protein [Wenzhouxiangella sp. 15181]RFP67186.1 multifunctional CCA addition/repair protein [Wenzhouxiangella sp. 15190]